MEAYSTDYFVDEAVKFLSAHLNGITLKPPMIFNIESISEATG
jgi:hypothetical protein